MYSQSDQLPPMLRQRRRQEPPYKRQPRRSENKRQSQNTKQSLLVLGGIVSLLGVWFLTPVSDWAVSTILVTVPLQADVDLGREAWKSLRKQYPSVPDKWGVDRIGWDLVNVLDSNDYLEWSFGVVHAPFANAFALPGGTVRVTDSLLKQLELTNGELAALLGHEMGHVLHRHSQARVIQNDLLQTVLSALVYDDQDDEQESFGEAVGELLLKSASWLGQLSFSRKDEYQADTTSWDLLIQSGKYHPQSLESLLSKLWSLEGDSSSSGKTSWESTHPGTKDRIAALQTKWEQLSKHDQYLLSKYPVR